MRGMGRLPGCWLRPTHPPAWLEVRSAPFWSSSCRSRCRPRGRAGEPPSWWPPLLACATPARRGGGRQVRISGPCCVQALRCMQALGCMQALAAVRPPAGGAAPLPARFCAFCSSPRMLLRNSEKKRRTCRRRGRGRGWAVGGADRGQRAHTRRHCHCRHCHLHRPSSCFRWVQARRASERGRCTYVILAAAGARRQRGRLLLGQRVCQRQHGGQHLLRLLRLPPPRLRLLMALLLLLLPLLLRRLPRPRGRGGGGSGSSRAGGRFRSSSSARAC